MDGCKPISSPIAPGSKLSLFDGDLLPDATEYRRIVRGLQYLTFTRPDLTYAVNQVCQFMHTPRTTYFNVVKTILCYLKGTLDYGIHITKNYSFDISCYSDADWVGCPDNRHSTSGYAIYVGSNLVSWSAKKQKTVSRSSTEAEYCGIANAVAEVQWLQYLLSDLGISFNNSPVLYYDNISATYLTANPICHCYTKHIEIDVHFVRDRQQKLRVLFVSSESQIADIMTKGISSPKFKMTCSKLTIIPMPFSLQEGVKDKG